MVVWFMGAWGGQVAGAPSYHRVGFVLVTQEIS
jgi:hypothetical protein